MRCVLYLRMSRDTQENSPKDQRKALTEYAKSHGYKIVGEYLDEGISGDSTEKRTAFLKMIADCQSKRFDMVLCWDQDRFGRFDPLEAGYWVKPMRDAGVVLETLAQGRVDWNDFAGRLVWSVNQEAKHSFLRDLARNVLRGNIERAKRGQHAGKAPFGYVMGEDGRLVFGDADAVATVRRIFELRCQGLGYHIIATKINAEGRPTPSGIKWSFETIRAVLHREIYAGTLVFGRQHRGKYSTCIDGTIVPAKPGSRILSSHPIRVPNAHPAIISRATWDATQLLRREPPKPHATRGNAGAPLAGLLRCGMCGSSMYSMLIKKPIYLCAKNFRRMGCGYCFVNQEFIHTAVIEEIRKTILKGSFEKLKESIRREVAKTSYRSTVDDDKRQLAKLDKQIRSASDRLLMVNQRLFADMESKLLAMKDQRELLAEKIIATARPRAVDIDEMAESIWRLNDIFSTLDGVQVRAELRQFIDHIRLDFKPGKTTAKGKSFVFDGLTLVLK